MATRVLFQAFGRHQACDIREGSNVQQFHSESCWELKTARSKPFPNKVCWLRTEDTKDKNAKKFFFSDCHVCAVCMCMCTCVGTYMWIQVSVYVYMCMWRANSDWEYFSSTLFTGGETLNQAQNLLIGLILLVLGILFFGFWAWNYKQSSTWTWHLRGFWGSDLGPSHCCWSVLTAQPSN